MAGGDYKTSYEWFEECGVDWKTLDMDGWDRRNLHLDMARKITKTEFIRKVRGSSFGPGRGMIKFLEWSNPEGFKHYVIYKNIGAVPGCGCKVCQSRS